MFTEKKKVIIFLTHKNNDFNHNARSLVMIAVMQLSTLGTDPLPHALDTNFIFTRFLYARHLHHDSPITEAREYM
jgi:hypothetical protein